MTHEEYLKMKNEFLDLFSEMFEEHDEETFKEIESRAWDLHLKIEEYEKVNNLGKWYRYNKKEEKSKAIVMV